MEQKRMCKTKKRFIGAVAMLAAAVVSFVCACYAWFIFNENVTSNEFTSPMTSMKFEANANITINLNGSEYIPEPDEDDGNIFENLVPGDEIEFIIEITQFSNRGQKIVVSFNDVSAYAIEGLGIKAEGAPDTYYSMMDMFLVSECKNANLEDDDAKYDAANWTSYKRLSKGCEIKEDELDETKYLASYIEIMEVAKPATAPSVTAPFRISFKIKFDDFENKDEIPIENDDDMPPVTWENVYLLEGQSMRVDTLFCREV